MEIVCACIFQNEKVFIAKRSTTYKGIWEFPGGKVEKGETYEEALKREIKEELNLEIAILQKLISIEDKTKDQPLNVHAYACYILSGKLQLTAHSEGCFLSPEAIDIAHFHSSDQPIIDACRHFLNMSKFVKLCD